jgi:hypothetical protein
VMQDCGTCRMNTRHEKGVCKVCVAKIEDQARIDRKLATLKTDAARIEFLLRELRTQKSVDAEGRIRTLSKPAAARGRNAKNIVRILREGKKRYAEAKAKGVNSVLPPESKIRKRVDADWNRRINPPPPPPARGSAGRAAAKEKGTTTERSLSKQQFAINLRDKHPEFAHAQIAEKITKRFKLTKQCSVRQVQRYLNDR